MYLVEAYLSLKGVLVNRPIFMNRTADNVEMYTP